MERNIAKLRRRYPEKFTEYDALNRNLEAERKELEPVMKFLDSTIPTRVSQETRFINRPDGKFLILNLNDPDPKLAHAAWLATRLFAKEIWSDEKHRQLAELIDQILIAIMEKQPPLKPGKPNAEEGKI